MKKNRDFKFYISLAVLAALLLLCAFAQNRIDASESDTGSGTTTAVKTTDGTFSDNTSLYDNDTSSVTTFYVTAMLGNDENEDSAFVDVTQSADAMCDALVQVGDDVGPVAGELGYGRQSANATIRGRKTAGDGFQIRLQQDSGLYNGQQVINLVKSRKRGGRFLSQLLFHKASEVSSMLSLQTSLVHLYVRDLTSDAAPDGFVDYGLYTQIEQLNRTALGNHALNENGALYEVRDYDFSPNDAIVLQSDASYDEETFNTYLENKGDTDNDALLSLIADIADENITPDEFVEKHFNLDNLTSFLAFEILTGNKNSVTGNFALYSPLNGDTWYLWPIDFDAAFDREEDTILSKEQDPDWRYGVSNYWDNLLFRKCLQSENVREALLQKAKSLVAEDGALYEGTFSEEVQTLADTVETYAYSDADKDDMPLTQEQYEALTEAIKTAPSSYLEDLETSLQLPMPFTIKAPTIEDGKLILHYTASYSFSGSELTYHVVLSRTPDGSDVLAEATTTDTSVTVADFPDAGQYFVIVTVQDADGNEQMAENAYETESTETSYNGVRCFWILDDGSVADDGD